MKMMKQNLSICYHLLKTKSQMIISIQGLLLTVMLLLKKHKCIYQSIMLPASSITRRDKPKVLVDLVCHVNLFCILMLMNQVLYILLEAMIGSTHGTMQLLLASVPIMIYFWILTVMKSLIFIYYFTNYATVSNAQSVHSFT